MTVDGRPFNSYLLGGFECSTHRRRDGRRLDVIAATRHDRHALSDYRQLRSHHIGTVRDGVRWHLIEAVPGQYDWSSFDPMIAAARTAGTQVIWDLMHYGWPDWTNPFDADFIARFADFAAAVAKRVGADGCYVPINEISFLAWGAGEVGYLNPFMTGRGDELKHILCRAAIAAIRRVKAVDTTALIVTAEPLIAVHPTDGSPDAIERASALHRVQYDAVDCLLGRRHPEFGGAETLVDVIGVNYYPYNQWRPHDPPTTVAEWEQIPLCDLLSQASLHYRRPLLIAETGCEGDARAGWLMMVLEQAALARMLGTEILGVCLYPILDHPGWDDDRHCPNGLLCGYSAPDRTVHGPLAAVISAAFGESCDDSDARDCNMVVLPEPGRVAPVHALAL